MGLGAAVAKEHDRKFSGFQSNPATEVAIIGSRDRRPAAVTARTQQSQLPLADSKRPERTPVVISNAAGMSTGGDSGVRIVETVSGGYPCWPGPTPQQIGP